jgi:hypothetical protein
MSIQPKDDVNHEVDSANSSKNDDTRPLDNPVIFTAEELYAKSTLDYIVDNVCIHSQKIDQINLKYE